MDTINDTNVEQVARGFYTCVSDNYDAEQRSDGTWVSGSIQGEGATAEEAIADYREQVLDEVTEWQMAGAILFENGEIRESRHAYQRARRMLEIEP